MHSLCSTDRANKAKYCFHCKSKQNLKPVQILISLEINISKTRKIMSKWFQIFVNLETIELITFRKVSSWKKWHNEECKFQNSTQQQKLTKMKHHKINIGFLLLFKLYNLLLKVSIKGKFLSVGISNHLHYTLKINNISNDVEWKFSKCN